MPHKPALRLVIDEDLNWKIAIELRARGYLDTTSAEEWGVAGRSVKDPLWLYIIERSNVPSVLVTFDNKMPRVHKDAILKQHSTLAVIDSKADRQGLTREEYTREVIHRRAHGMRTQPKGTRYKYTLTGRKLLTL
ncbi:MAG: hypothetical protein ACRDNB_04375 [Gaiellaceae bacterium]